MRHCPACGAEHNRLTCPACADRKSREAYLNLQTSYLPAILTGRMDLHLNRRTHSGPYHVALVGDPQHGYCGHLLDGPQQRRRMPYSEKLRADLCAKCVAVFDAIVAAELRRAEAQ